MSQSDGSSNPKSVIAIYSIDSNDLEKSNYRAIWNEYVTSGDEETHCTNILHCEMEAIKMLQILSNVASIDKELKDLIKEEKECGANYIFVGPVIGEPIGGFYIDALIN